jgi:RNAse (barnase) inhibitor barstar
LIKENQMKDYKGENKDFLWGAIAAVLMLAPAMIVYIWKTGGLS